VSRRPTHETMHGKDLLAGDVGYFPKHPHYGPQDDAYRLAGLTASEGRLNRLRLHEIYIKLTQSTSPASESNTNVRG